MSQQLSLQPDARELVARAMERIRRAGLLPAAELDALERAVRGELQPRTRLPGWQHVVDHWFAEAEKALGERPPRPTDTELRALRQAMQRLGGADATKRAITWFWKWRNSLKWDVIPGPNPMAFSKHLDRVREYATKRIRAQREAEKLRRHVERQEEQLRARRQVEAQQTNNRRQELHQQVQQVASRMTY